MADPEVTADLLRLANGASAGVRGQVSSVADAISRIGVTRSAALLVTSGIEGVQKPICVACRRRCENGISVAVR